MEFGGKDLDFITQTRKLEINTLKENSRQSRFLYSGFGLLCLIAPFLGIVFIWHFFPDAFFDLYEFYVGGAKQIEWTASQPHYHAEGAASIILERVVVHTLVLIWNIKKQILLITICIAFLAILTNKINRNFGNKYNLFAKSSIFFILSGFILFIFRPGLSSLFFGAVLSLIFIINFPLSHLLVNAVQQYKKSAMAGVGILSISGLTHIFAPACLLGLVFSFNKRFKQLSATATKIWICLLCFPLVSAFYLSGKPIALSQGVSRITNIDQLYDLKIDPSSNRLFVTRIRPYRPSYIFNLGEMKNRPREFLLPSREMEEIAVDSVSRRIFHAARDNPDINEPLTLLIVNADTSEVLKKWQIPFINTGSTKLALARSLGYIFISTENGPLFRVDENSGDFIQLVGPDVNPIILMDKDHGALYVHWGNSSALMALDPTTLRQISSSLAPKADFRMAMSRTRKELYLPDPYRGRIWVYSTPDLQLIRKIKAQFGVRAIAVDEKRSLLLSGSIVTGFFDTIDLATGQILNHQYAGPYCRCIAIDEKRRRAYITLTYDGLFQLEY